MSCFSVATICSRVTILSSTRSLMKWWRMSICFFLLCWMRFLDILIAFRLSQYYVMTFCSTLYSFSICFIQINWEQLLLATIYSGSNVDKDTHFWFLLNQGIDCFLRRNILHKCFFYHRHYLPNLHHRRLYPPFFACSMTLADSCKVLFLSSTTPFCRGVMGDENSWPIPLEDKNS